MLEMINHAILNLRTRRASSAIAAIIPHDYPNSFLDTLRSPQAGHYWVGCDVSHDMLTVASERETSTAGDLFHHDMGTGLPFQPASFDGCISISALQWLCYSNTAAQVPKRRLVRFFSALYGVLKRGARAVLQFYPETPEQAVLISGEGDRRLERSDSSFTYHSLLN